MDAILLDLNVLGLAYDGVGIVILGVPTAFMGVTSIAAEAGTYWDENRFVMRRLIEQKLDTGVGSLFLAAGFAFQIIAAVHWRFIAPAMAVLWTALLLLPLVYALVRRRTVRTNEVRAAAAAAKT